MRQDSDKRHRRMRDSDGVHDADPYSFQVAHRRLAWLLRISGVINGVLAFAVVALCAAIAQIMPLKEVRVALVKSSPADDRMYSVEPLEQNTQGFDLLMEAAARRYVRSILEIDETTQKLRWDEARSFSEAEFWNGWIGAHTQRVADAIGDGLQREVVVETTHRLEQRQDEWLIAVDFRQIDRFAGEQVGETSLRAYVRLVTLPLRIKASERFTNPLGITVLDIAVKQRGGQETANSEGGAQL